MDVAENRQLNVNLLSLSCLRRGPLSTFHARRRFHFDGGGPAGVDAAKSQSVLETNCSAPGLSVRICPHGGTPPAISTFAESDRRSCSS